MTATIQAPATRDPHDLASAVVLLLDNEQIEPVDILWRHPSGNVFVGPLPEDIHTDSISIGTVVFWMHLYQQPASSYQKGTDQ